VSDEEVLRLRVALYPHNKFYVLLLADELQAQYAYRRFKALRKATAVRLTAIAGEHVVQAERCMARGSLFRVPVLSMIEVEVNRLQYETMHVEIVAGRRPPIGVHDSMFTDGEWVHGVSVKVGARWIINAVMNLQITPADFFNGQTHRPDVR